MAKLTAWIFTIIGVLSLPPIMAMLSQNMWWWIFSILFLIVGITKLMRNYKHK